MKDRLLIGTRKGLFVLTPKGDSYEIASHSFSGVAVNYAFADPRDGVLYAAIQDGHFGPKLHRSDDGGKVWTELTPPAFPAAAKSADGGEAPAVSVLWTVAPGGSDEPGVLWCGTVPGGLFRSDNRGDTWTLNRPLWERPERAKWFGGGFSEPGIHSVCVDPGSSKRVIVGVSCGGVWETTDGGENWELRTKGMWAEFMPPEEKEEGAVQDPHLVVQCPAAPEVFWTQHHNGIFRSGDGLRSWTEVMAKPSSFGFAVAVHPRDPETAWFVPAIKDEMRYPVDGKFVVTRTKDGGKSFDVLTKGLPKERAYDLVYRHALDIDDGGDGLALGSTTGGVWTTKDGGENWTLLPERLPPVYSVRYA